jgi:WXG100 family type VII secretion target
MIKIKVQPEEIKEISKAYENCSQVIQHVILDLSKAQSELSNIWQGESYRSFENQYYQIKPELEKFANLLDDMYTKLNEIAVVIEETDKSIAHSVSKNEIIK